jgi:hypothetical protein
LVIEAVEEQHGVTVERAIGDGAYGTGDNRAACSERGTDLVSPVAAPSGPEVHKTAFGIDLEARQVTCPQGHVVSDPKTVKDAQGRPVLLLTFERKACEACPLFSRCVQSKTKGVRSARITTKLSCKMLAHGSRGKSSSASLRYAQPSNARLLVWYNMASDRAAMSAGPRTASKPSGRALVNLRRLFTLFEGDMNRMRQVLAMVS